MGIDDEERFRQNLMRVAEQNRREEAATERKMRREQNQRDRGVGYLIWIARKHARMGQSQLARCMGTSRSAISRWENGRHLPNLFTLERIAQETNLELVIGLREPEAGPDEFVALAVLEDEGPMTEVRMLRDFRGGTGPVPPTAWREKIGYEVTGFSELMTVGSGLRSAP
jgi:transcriptional regulator with XRE-family HTH domain